MDKLKSFYGRPAYDGTVEVSIYITASAQGKGLGKRLLTFAEPMQALKIKVLLAFIFSHNLPSIKLFNLFNYKYGVNCQVWQLWMEKPQLNYFGKTFRFMFVHKLIKIRCKLCCIDFSLR